MSALGHKQTLQRMPTYVRFTPESGHVQCKTACPLYPRKRTCGGLTRHYFMLLALALGIGGHRGGRLRACLMVTHRRP